MCDFLPFKGTGFLFRKKLNFNRENRYQKLLSSFQYSTESTLKKQQIFLLSTFLKIHFLSPKKFRFDKLQKLLSPATCSSNYSSNIIQLNYGKETVATHVRSNVSRRRVSQWREIAKERQQSLCHPLNRRAAFSRRGTPSISRLVATSK